MKSPEQAMLDAIARDIDQHPDVLRPVDAKLTGRCRALSAGLDVDLDVPRKVCYESKQWAARNLQANAMTAVRADNQHSKETSHDLAYTFGTRATST
jgi:hypothetical protein